MSKRDKVFLIAALVFLALACIFAICIRAYELGVISEENAINEHHIELAKQDIVAEYGFEAVLWLNIEKVKNLEGRDDFYIFTCLTESDEMYQYRFAVTIREVNGEIDVDTWRIKEG